jgi:hypothetical protein
MTNIIESVSLRSMLGKWLDRRHKRRRQRSLEECLSKMDPHTLNDIGFNALLELANDPKGRAEGAVIVALKTMVGRTF